MFLSDLSLAASLASSGMTDNSPYSFSDDDNRSNEDDGIGTSDDETPVGSSAASSASNEAEEDKKSESSSIFENDSSPNLGNVQRRKVIRPDQAALSQLLAFDEVSF